MLEWNFRNKLKHKQSITAKEFEKICKKQDEIFNNQKERLGYDKTKYQVVYFVNSERDLISKSYTYRVDIGDGEKHMICITLTDWCLYVIIKNKLMLYIIIK